jgi:penicillin-binding protein 1C
MRRRSGIILAATAVVAGIAGWIAFESAIRNSPVPAGLNEPAPFTREFTDFRGRTFYVESNKDVRESIPVSLRDMGPWLPFATVAIEDHRFWSHHGVDWHATLGAAVRNARNGRIISGASTITQQLVKITSGRTKRTLGAKYTEAFAALNLERSFDKKKILENYINRIDYGNRRTGAEAAARAYFGKPAKNLSLAEAIYLAGLPQSPTRLSPWKSPQGALARYRHNVARIAPLLPPGITAKSLLDNPPRVERNDSPSEAGHFARLVTATHPAAVPVLKTTLDLDIQRSAERMLRDHLAASESSGVKDAAIVVIDNATGEVRALACAGQSKHAAINSATQPRSCGSTLKPFLYLAAIDRKVMTAATLVPDTADAISGAYADYDPQNYNNRFYGPVRVREALGNSLNVPAVATLSRLGARETFDKLRRWGLDFPGTFDSYGAGFILGNASVRLLDLTSAYASLARGGDAWPARLTPRDAIESTNPASPESCAIVTDILCDNDARRLSFGLASPLHLAQRVAVKTGTSSGFRDGWCIGFNGTHTIGVWAGNLAGQPMNEALAIRSAAPLWNAVMRHLLANGDKPLPEPAETGNLRKLQVAAETGLLPRPGEKTVTEWFLAGTQPRENASTLYSDGVLQLPAEYAAWCASPENRLGARVRTSDLQILFPKNDASFAINPTLPARQQTLNFMASQPGCVWKVNGEPAENSFPLRPGTWTVTAEKDGALATARFTVE